MKKIIPLIFSGFVLLYAIPRIINYQGKVVNADSVGLNGNYEMKFRLYTSESGGSPIWEQIFPSVPVTNGLFSVELSGFPDTVSFSGEYWLEVEIGGEILTPRGRLTASPYTLRARTVEKAIQGIKRRGSPISHTGTMVLAGSSGVTLTEAGDSIFLFFTSEGGGTGGGFSFTNPFNIDCLPSRETIKPTLAVSSIVSAVKADTSFSNYVKFYAIGLPLGASVDFEPDSCIPTNTVKMTITTSSSTPAGSYPITIAGVSGENIARTVFTLVVEYETYTWSQTTTAQFDENTNVNVQTTGDMVWLGMLDLGTGEDGDFHATSNMTLNAGTYNFRTFRIDPGVTVSVERNTPTPLVIKCLGEVVISGWLDLSGQNGGNGSGGTGGAGGLGGCAGYSGGKGGDGYSNGSPGNGPGAGPGGNRGCYAEGGSGGGYGTYGGNCGRGSGLSYGNPQLTTMYGGSGGGGGGGRSDANSGGGGGGGGGGALLLTAQKIIINSGGGINANGGVGGSYSGYCSGGGGGGSGGSIWLRAEKIINTGTIQANGGSGGYGNSSGCSGGYGRIRMDCVSYTKSHPFYTDGTISPNVGWSEMPSTYLPRGQTTTYIIAPTGIRRWGILQYSRDISMSGTSLQIDVLDSSGTELLTNVPSGTDLHLAGIDAAVYPAIRIRATLTTSNTAYSPKLLDWTLTYQANP